MGAPKQILASVYKNTEQIINFHCGFIHKFLKMKL